MERREGERGGEVEGREGKKGKRDEQGRLSCTCPHGNTQIGPDF